MAVDYFLKLDGIQGEATDHNFKDQIQLLSFSWGGTRSVRLHGTGGSGAGKVDLSDFSVTKHLDKSSPLFKALTRDAHRHRDFERVKAGATASRFSRSTSRNCLSLRISFRVG
jgi:type VI secretion system secreted protein Hcp